jgi:hypothetical protein
MKITEVDVFVEMKTAGFRLEKKHEFLPYQYFLVFRR